MYLYISALLHDVYRSRKQALFLFHFTYEELLKNEVNGQALKGCGEKGSQ
ncbi:hypothetical protein HMPREF0322_02536 [Desulfitobacterium hafniense DP7]|uniref:Uncharacterized protein n=1 Tax=Desulfitobacterium hafniense DP7 TaxID=537010 RepID=G9XNJ4_DESHA|nr:hypothetical protein HMPREF0322_02536 [Desulfitobacterium hafniense DP7]